ncbi:hypothetical protein Tco_0595770 [Tanacetum coccineum]
MRTIQKVHCGFIDVVNDLKTQGVIGRPGISAIRAVPSTAHGMLKFPVDGGIVTIHGPRRLQKWSILLGEHNISYRPRTAVKGQILADFLIEKPETDIVLPQSEVKLPEPWILFTDGS